MTDPTTMSRVALPIAQGDALIDALFDEEVCVVGIFGHAPLTGAVAVENVLNEALRHTVFPVSKHSHWLETLFSAMDSATSAQINVSYSFEKRMVYLSVLNMPLTLPGPSNQERLRAVLLLFIVSDVIILAQSTPMLDVATLSMLRKLTDLRGYFFSDIHTNHKEGHPFASRDSSDISQYDGTSTKIPSKSPPGSEANIRTQATLRGLLNQIPVAARREKPPHLLVLFIPTTPLPPLSPGDVVAEQATLQQQIRQVFAICGIPFEERASTQDRSETRQKGPAPLFCLPTDPGTAFAFVYRHPSPQLSAERADDWLTEMMTDYFSKSGLNEHTLSNSTSPARDADAPTHFRSNHHREQDDGFIAGIRERLNDVLAQDSSFMGFGHLRSARSFLASLSALHECLLPRSDLPAARTPFPLVDKFLLAQAQQAQETSLDLCSTAKALALEAYATNLPAAYSQREHYQRVFRAAWLFFAKARGCKTLFYFNQFVDQAAELWNERRVCEVYSFHGQPCTHKRHNTPEETVTHDDLNLDVMEHASKFLRMCSCVCGRTQTARKDIFAIAQVNGLLVEERCCVSAIEAKVPIAFACKQTNAPTHDHENGFTRAASQPPHEGPHGNIRGDSATTHNNENPHGHRSDGSSRSTIAEDGAAMGNGRQPQRTNMHRRPELGVPAPLEKGRLQPGANHVPVASTNGKPSAKDAELAPQVTKDERNGYGASDTSMNNSNAKSRAVGKRSSSSSSLIAVADAMADDETFSSITRPEAPAAPPQRPLSKASHPGSTKATAKRDDVVMVEHVGEASSRKDSFATMDHRRASHEFNANFPHITVTADNSHADGFSATPLSYMHVHGHSAGTDSHLGTGTTAANVVRGEAVRASAHHRHLLAPFSTHNHHHHHHHDGSTHGSNLTGTHLSTARDALVEANVREDGGHFEEDLGKRRGEGAAEKSYNQKHFSRNSVHPPSAYDVIEDEGDEGDDDISITTLTISEQPPILPLKEPGAFCLYKFGGAAAYNPSRGLVHQSGLVAGATFLLPFDLKTKKPKNSAPTGDTSQHENASETHKHRDGTTTINDEGLDSSSNSTTDARGRSKKPKKGGGKVRLFIGYEYETAAGTRFLAHTATELVKVNQSTGHVKGSARVTLKSDMPIFSASHISGEMAQLVRFYIVVPSTPIRVQLQIALMFRFYHITTQSILLASNGFYMLHFPRVFLWQGQPIKAPSTQEGLSQCIMRSYPLSFINGDDVGPKQAKHESATHGKGHNRSKQLETTPTKQQAGEMAHGVAHTNESASNNSKSGSRNKKKSNKGGQSLHPVKQG